MVFPDVVKNKKPSKTFKAYSIGYFHTDITQVRTGRGKLRLFVAIDRTSKYVYVELHEKADRNIAAQFLRNLVETVAYRIHTVLTDNGIEFTHQARHKYAFEHLFERVCDEHGIEHRVARLNYPWKNGQVERMNRTKGNDRQSLFIQSEGEIYWKRASDKSPESNEFISD